ncbi:MAG: hypothetical protein KGR68_15310 [Betaproteobacteria bacterium]|nr:hypothetical protein [Betaproteobacteria bacterium]
MTAHNRIPDDYARQMREAYEAPTQPSIRVVAAHFGYDPEAVRDAIRRAGGTIRRCGKRRADALPVPDNKVQDLMRSGWPARAIAARYGVPAVAVARALQRARRAEARQ